MPLTGTHPPSWELKETVVLLYFAAFKVGAKAISEILKDRGISPKVRDRKSVESKLYSMHSWWYHGGYLYVEGVWDLVRVGRYLQMLFPYEKQFLELVEFDLHEIMIVREVQFYSLRFSDICADIDLQYQDIVTLQRLKPELFWRPLLRSKDSIHWSIPDTVILEYKTAEGIARGLLPCPWGHTHGCDHTRWIFEMLKRSHRETPQVDRGGLLLI